ncbi:MAG TPA: threonine synthase [Caulobacteraceae bacterium]|nr:threonine synthase [Caulobacteraceae bacterium]
MKYLSTRGDAPPLGFVDTLLAGLAPDGGLYCPQTWPRLTAAEIAAFAGRPYAEVAADILGRFAGGEIAAGDLERLCAEAYAGFDHPAVTPLVQLAPDRFLLELFHGPTLAFKDLAMQILGRLYAHVLAARGRTMTIVCATSGDTGGAAVEAFAGLEAVRIVALFPEGRISEVQRRFMTTTSAANVRSVAVAGDFDDCQAILKSLFLDEAFAAAVNLSAVNSINFARIAAQTVYYFTAATALGAPSRAVDFAVPTGNFGDAFAGYAARLMGLPIGRIIVATNANDIVARALATGDYRRGNARATQSPAMDIQVASNFERLFFECAGRDAAAAAAAFRAFAADGAVRTPSPVLAAMREVLVGAAVSEEETARTIAATLRETGQLIDPHTAVAVAGAARVRPHPAAAPLVIVSTAHPAKFPEAVTEATGAAPPPPAAVRARAAVPERIDRLPAEVEAVKAYVRAFARP